MINDTDRINFIASHMQMEYGRRDQSSWSMPNFDWVMSGREACSPDDLRAKIDEIMVIEGWKA